MFSLAFRRLQCWLSTSVTSISKKRTLVTVSPILTYGEWHQMNIVIVFNHAKYGDK